MSRKKRKPTKGQIETIETFRRFLNRYYNVPTKVFDGFREMLIYYAVTEADWLKYDRLYSAVAILLLQRYKLSGLEIFQALQDYDAICTSVLPDPETGEGGEDWSDLMAELKDATGVVVHSGPDNRLVCECEWEEEVYEEE